MWIDSIDQSGDKPEVLFWWKDIAMFAELDPGVLHPVVIWGTAEGFEVSVEFNDYAALQKEINEYLKE